jgi:uncharacterized membrane protein YphA (DoxX/SURF4 family)
LGEALDVVVDPVCTCVAAAVRPSKALHIGLWVVQALLGVAFLGAGFTKLTQPLDQLATQMTFVTYTPAALVRFIGLAEVLGALGLVLPAATRILPFLTPLAATGLATIMVLAMGTHATHGELQVLPANLVLGGLAAFVAWGRFKKAPISPR